MTASPVARPADPARHDVMSRLAALPSNKQAELLARLRRPSAVAPDLAQPIVSFRPNLGARLRLFCFPHAGGGPSMFRTWSERLPDDVDVCAVCLPGREGRLGEAPIRRMAPLVDSLAEAITPHLDGEYAFFGHSMGALVAFELALHLRRTCGREPSRLFLAAYRAPQLPNPNIRIHKLPDEVLKTVLEREGTPPEILRNAELMGAILPTLRADIELCETYEYAPNAPLTCPLSVFGGDADVLVRPADLAGWRRHSTGEFALRIFSGSHFFLQSAQQHLLAAIQDNVVSSRTIKKAECAHV